MLLTRNPQHYADLAKRPRRGTTAMEYLMMMSLIIVVALVGIGFFGTSTQNVTVAAADAIAKSVNR